MGDTDASNTPLGQNITANTLCGITGEGPNDAFMPCPDGTRGRFVIVQRTAVKFDTARNFLIINEIDIHVGIENGELTTIAFTS